MMNFCTLFNSYYLQKGLATYLSLERVTDDFHLYVMAFDKECYECLKNLELKRMTVELVDDFESPELKNVKQTRNVAEYCWTCTPSVTHHFLSKYNLPSITYLDSDLFFLNDPKILFDEIGSASIALSEHWFQHENNRAGRFCVQFVFFKNDNNGLNALKYWREKCIEWCYARYEDGKYGDQTYIEDIYNKFKGVHVIKHRGCGLATWNYKLYQYPDKNTLVFNQITYPIVFFHFHGVKFLAEGNNLVLTSGDGSLPQVLQPLFYTPYARLMVTIYNKYLGASFENFILKDISIWKKCYNIIKHSLHDNPIAKFFYYKVFDIRYNGYDKK